MSGISTKHFLFQSIWVDMALTVADYLYKRVYPELSNPGMAMYDMEVLHAQVASNNAKGASQPLSLEAQWNLTSNVLFLSWFNMNDKTSEGHPESFATAKVKFEDPTPWKKEWDRLTYLILARIETLEDLAGQGLANRLSKDMAYNLFKNVVDYAVRYRGMDNVVLHKYEARAEITLDPDQHGTWHMPPHWIDSVSHLAGLVMNASDASNTHDYFYVTPGCDSFRLIEPLSAASRYRNYVRMTPCDREPGMYSGDVYILRDNAIIGKLEQIRFRRVPRLLMDRFFSPPSTTSTPASKAPARPVKSTPQTTTKPPPIDQKRTLPASTGTSSSSSSSFSALSNDAARNTPVSKGSASSASSLHEPDEAAVNKPDVKISNEPIPTSTHTRGETEAKEAPAGSESEISAQCLSLIAQETGLTLSDLDLSATFVQLGIDSLMSLVLTEKFRVQLGVEVKSSLFLECETVADMKSWIETYC